MSIVRFPVVAFAFLVDLLRHVPGARVVERHALWVVAALLLAALIALGVWMAQRSPQRITVAELVAGNLSAMQTWIIVSGELREQQSATNQHRYILTDPAVPNATIHVTSFVELPVGRKTVSGHLIGGNRRAQPGFAWVGQLRADPVVAPEPEPPWIAFALAGLGLFIAVGARTAYPMFFHQARRAPAPRATTLHVGVRHGWEQSDEQVVPATLELQAGTPVELRLPGNELQRLRLHSAHSGVEVGELRRLFRSEPALVLRPASGDLMITFASADDRDAAFAALVADAQPTVA